MAKTIGLGRGLGALMDLDTTSISGPSSINEVELDLIIPNPNQPRTFFDEEALEELAASIKELGVISPITLRKNEDNTYMIIAGERRYRAAKSIGLRTIPAYIRTAADDQMMEMALIENIQREDLNAIEIALTFYRLIKDYNLTQERLSERVGKKRATISNYIRLLQLPAEIQMGLKDRKIDMGHARAILGLENAADQLKIYNLILKNAYPVRTVEGMVRNFLETGNFQPKEKEKPKKSNKLNELKEMGELKSHLSKIFSVKVQLTCDEKGKGRITIPFANDEELMKIMQLMDKI
ncbi:MAG TPA: ParB/RepB/Spo0J family partition protein [Bacteroidales bacterium]|nr:ParB/RepB/Spo0J family partition protein [Bacteroidales bacterium]